MYIGVTGGIVICYNAWEEILLVDRTQSGRVALSARVFPDDGWDSRALFTRGGAAWPQSLTVWPLKSIWRKAG